MWKVSSRRAREVLLAVEIRLAERPRLDALVGAWQSLAATAPSSPGRVRPVKVTTCLVGKGCRPGAARGWEDWFA
jgi:hypothetical protein